MPIHMAIQKSASCVAKNFPFMTWLVCPLLIVSFSILGAWVYWVFYMGDGHEWSDEYRDVNAALLECLPHFQDCDEDLYDVDTAKWNCRFGGYDASILPSDFEYWPTDTNVTRCDKECDHAYSSCLAVFMIWSMPFNTTVYCLIMCFFCYFFGGQSFRSMEDNDIGRMKYVFYMFMCIIILCWCTASLAVAHGD